MNNILLKSATDLTPLKKFIKEKVIPHSNAKSEEDSFPWFLYQELHKLGWLQAFVPEQLGGMGISTTDLIWIAREIGYGSGGMLTSVMANMVALLPIFLHGNESLKKTIAKDVIDNFSLASFCWTEPETGSDVIAIKTNLTKVSGGWILNGKKCFISNAGFSKRLTVVCKTAGITNPKDAITLVYVPAETKGVTRGKALLKLGQRDSNTSELYFDNVFVPEEYLLVRPGKGFEVAFHCLQRSKTMIAAACIGICDRAYDLALEHLSLRRLYKKPLLAQPKIQGLLSQLQTELHAGWLLNCMAATSWDFGLPTIKEASMAKLFCAQLADKFTGHALELFGGYGYCREYEIERLHRDAKLFRILEGPTFVQEAILSKELFRKYLLQSEQVDLREVA